MRSVDDDERSIFVCIARHETSHYGRSQKTWEKERRGRVENRKGLYESLFEKGVLQNLDHSETCDVLFFASFRMIPFLVLQNSKLMKFISKK